MDDFLFNNGYEAYTTSQIWQALNNYGMSNKVLEVHAKEQNETNRQDFLRLTEIFTAEQRFCVDER